MKERRQIIKKSESKFTENMQKIIEERSGKENNNWVMKETQKEGQK